MAALYTFPDQRTLQRYEKATPKYMHPNHIPFAVIAEGLISPAKCTEMAEACGKFNGYTHDGCNAYTREVGHIPQLDYVRDFGHAMNQTFWGYDLDLATVTWMQTYFKDSDYQMHMDATAGQMRKLTAVVFLTDEESYEGGELEIYFHPTSLKIPRKQGTIVLFQPWILHRVYPVTAGMRQSLNVSFWGPNFK